MAKKVKEIKEELLLKTKDLKLVSVNGTIYFGKKRTKDDVTTVSEAVAVPDGNLENAIKTWLKADNLNELEEIEISGDATFAVRKLNETEQIVVDKVVLEAAIGHSSAVAKIINNSF